MTQATSSKLDRELVTAVRAAERGVVRVDGERGQSVSGCVYAPDLVLTSNAELGRGEPTQVTGHDGRAYAAELVGRDPSYDLALLRVSASDLVPLVFADGNEVAVGQLALALGRPGKAIRASLRIVGLVADDVETPSGGRLARYIESDRAFPPGFAGGPLIDIAGRALGMNSGRLLRGADLSLTRETLEPSVRQLLAHGTIPRGYIGVAAQPVRLPPELREKLGRRSGALVLAVERGGPAERAGIRFGDTLIAIDGQPVSGPRELTARLRDRGGAALVLQLVRAGELLESNLTAALRGGSGQSPGAPDE